MEENKLQWSRNKDLKGLKKLDWELDEKNHTCSYRNFFWVFRWTKQFKLLDISDYHNSDGWVKNIVCSIRNSTGRGKYRLENWWNKTSFCLWSSLRFNLEMKQFLGHISQSSLTKEVHHGSKKTFLIRHYSAQSEPSIRIPMAKKTKPKVTERKISEKENHQK